MNSGILNDLDIHPRLIAAAQRGGYSTSWKLLETSLGDVKAKTGLNSSEAERLVAAAAQQCCPSFTRAWDLSQESGFIPRHSTHIQLGCKNLDSFLGGGMPCIGITEIAGESGSGKTQMALHIALQAQLPISKGGLGKVVVYICTESKFPVTRLNQLTSFRKGEKTFNGKCFADNIFVHHLPDMDNLLDCVRYQLPKFVSHRSVGVIIIDSVAAVFRAEEEAQMLKSKMVQQLGFRLRQLSDKQNVAVIAINQVQALIGNKQCGFGTVNDFVPALGLSWANLVTTRLVLQKTSFSAFQRTPSTRNIAVRLPEASTTEEVSAGECRVRTMEIVFCPWMPRKSCPFIVTERRIQDFSSHNDQIRFSNSLLG